MLKERTVRISDLFWGVLSHWKAILVFVIIGAVAGACYSYLSPGKKAVSAETSGVTMKLGNAEKSIISLYVKYAGLYKEQMSFIQSDALMEIEPANTFRCSMIYYIACEEPDKIDGIVAAYNIRLNELSDKYGLPNSFSISKNPGTLSSDSANNLIVEGGDSCVISVVVYGTSTEDCNAMINEADDYIFEIKVQVEQTFGKHTVTSFRGEMSKAPTTKIISRQKSAVDDLNAINTNMVNIKKNQDPDFVEILDYSAENHPEYEDPENIPDKISTFEEVKNTSRNAGNFSIKTVAIGAAVGLVLALIVLAVIYSLRNRIGPEDDIESLFGIPHFAVALHCGRRKRNALDAALYKKRCRRLPVLDAEGEAVLAASNIRVSCSRNGVDRVFAVGSLMSEAERSFIEKTAKMLEKDGIELTAGRDILIFPDDLEKAADTGNIILVEANGRSRFDNIASEVRKCSDQGIRILGMITTG